MTTTVSISSPSRRTEEETIAEPNVNEIELHCWVCGEMADHDGLICQACRDELENTVE